MKLANLDYVFGVTTQARASLDATTTPGPITFVDLCGGPGGFTEYLLRRCHARGWGMSLTEAAGANGCDWRLDHVPGVLAHTTTAGAGAAAPADSASAPDARGSRDTQWRFKQVVGEDGTGDMYKEENIAALAGEVRGEWPAHGGCCSGPLT